MFTQTICTKFYQWIDEHIEQPIDTWVEQQHEECQELPWWNPLRWLCWLVTTLVKVIVYVLITIPKLITTITCYTIHISIALVFKPGKVSFIMGEFSTFYHQMQLNFNGSLNVLKEIKPNPIDKKGWELVFYDEFNDLQLDTNKWNTEEYYGGKYHPGNIVNNNPPKPPKEYLSDKNFEFTGNSIKLIAKRENVPISYISNNINYGNFIIEHTIGQIDSFHSWSSFPPKYQQQYGYFEIRCKMPDTPGMWPAFWLYGDEGDEIDIFEYYTGKYTMKFQSNYHYYRNGIHETSCIAHTGPVGMEKFHIYGLEWNDDKIKWYYDNMLIRVMPNIGFHYPMHIIINTAVDDGAGMGLEDAEFPNNFEVDYIRAYKKI